MTNDSARNKIHGRTAAIVLAAITLIVAGYAVHLRRQSEYIAHRAALGIPTTQSMTAALRRQEAARGSLEVSYNYVYHGQKGMIVRYAQAGDESFIELASDKLTQTDSFDASSGEGRETIVTKETARGIIMDQPGSPLCSAMISDPIRLPLDTTTLMDALERGEVSDSVDPIDGHPCWRVKIRSTEDYLESYLVWVDPKIGFLPRRIVSVYKKSPPRFQSFSNYKQFRSGIWFPMRTSGGDVGGAAAYVSTVTEVHISRPIAKGSLAIRFPPGMKVEDYPNPKHIAP